MKSQGEHTPKPQVSDAPAARHENTAPAVNPPAGIVPTVAPVGLYMPTMYCPITLHLHPGADEADAHTEAWLDRYGLYSDTTQRARLLSTRCGRLAAHMAPFCPSPELLNVHADYCTWAFAFDDEFCDEGPIRFHPAEQTEAFNRMLRAIEVTEYPIDPDDNYSSALRDIRIRLDTFASPAQGDRFVEWMRGYFMIELWKSGNAARGILPNLNDYAVARLYGGGGLVFSQLPASYEDLMLDPRTVARRDVRALLEAASTLVCWDSDLLAFAKERERTSDGNNLIDIIANEFELSLQEAINTAMDLRNRVMCFYLRLGKALREEANPELHRYSILLDQYVRGFLEWALEASTQHRYLRSDGTLPFTFEGWTTDSLPEEATEPVAIPSIAWWWQHDPVKPQKISRAVSSAN